MMGIKTTETPYDDYTGEPGDDIEVFEFVIDGTLYSMDACEATRNEIRGKFADYIRVAKPRTHIGNKAAEIRQWAREEGMGVPDTGRIPNQVVRKYYEAHP